MKPGVITVASHGEIGTSQSPPADAQTSWRRRGAFAEWIASPENPLTARVMVNRIWQHHFGEGIVRTPSNFGKTGEAAHAPRTAGLAGDGIRPRRARASKSMHRLMMNSEAYQRASDDIENAAKIDPREPLSLAHAARVAWKPKSFAIQMMAVAGNLDLKVGGPAVYPYIDPSLFQSSSKRTWPGKSDDDRSGDLAAQRLCVLQALDPAADARYLRQARFGRLLRPPQPQHHRPAGPDPDEQRVRDDGSRASCRTPAAGSRSRSASAE